MAVIKHKRIVEWERNNFTDPNDINRLRGDFSMVSKLLGRWWLGTGHWLVAKRKLHTLFFNHKGKHLSALWRGKKIT